MASSPSARPVAISSTNDGDSPASVATARAYARTGPSPRATVPSKSKMRMGRGTDLLQGDERVRKLDALSIVKDMCGRNDHDR
jgi:hypothetical protein